MNDCKEGYIINPKTGKCRKQCEDGKVINPKTGYCVKIKVAKVDYKKCKEGKERHPVTKRCRKIVGLPPKSPKKSSPVARSPKQQLTKDKDVILHCSKLIPLPQLETPSFFISIISAFFYSNGMRNAICKHLNKWDFDKKESNVAIELLKKSKLSDVSDIDCFFIKRKNTGVIPTSYRISTLKRILEKLHMYDDAIIFNLRTGKKNEATTPFELSEDRVKEPMRPDLLIFMAQGSFLDDKSKIVYKKSGKMIGRGYFDKGSIFYNNAEYLIDSHCTESISLEEFNESGIENQQYIAGVTCNSIRFLYNGWNANTVDTSFTHRKIKNKKPCGLIKHDWLYDDKMLSFDKETCKLVDPELDENKNTIIFNRESAVDKYYFAVRKDLCV